MCGLWSRELVSLFAGMLLQLALALLPPPAIRVWCSFVVAMESRSGSASCEYSSSVAGDLSSDSSSGGQTPRSDGIAGSASGGQTPRDDPSSDGGRASCSGETLRSCVSVADLDNSESSSDSDRSDASGSASGDFPTTAPTLIDGPLIEARSAHSQRHQGNCSRACNRCYYNFNQAKLESACSFRHPMTGETLSYLVEHPGAAAGRAAWGLGCCVCRASRTCNRARLSKFGKCAIAGSKVRSGSHLARHSSTECHQIALQEYFKNNGILQGRLGALIYHVCLRIPFAVVRFLASTHGARVRCSTHLIPSICCSPTMRRFLPPSPHPSPPIHSSAPQLIS